MFAHRAAMALSVVSTVLVLSACDSMPRVAKEGGKDFSSLSQVTVPERIVESLAAAEKAQKLGKTSDALEELDDAIRLEPGSKHPWLKKSQIHFDARQYGQAITSAQEVLQRDATDLTAKSILAVSGLRVSAQALEQLRKANEVNGSARTEAESVAKLIREALGEPILIPALPTAAKADGRPEGSARPAPRRAAARPTNTVARPATPVAPGAAPVVTAAPVKPATSGAVSSNSSRGNNPFGALQ